MKELLVRGLQAAGFATLLVLAGCQPVGEPPARDTVGVNGAGVVTAMPNEAVVTLQVHLRGEDVEALRGQAERRVAKLLARLAEMGIPDDAIDSSDIVSHRESAVQRDEELVAERFFVRRSVEVTTRELDQVGKLMDAATEAGMNQLSTPRYRIADPRAVYREALAAAAADARANAEALATELGRSLGKALEIEEHGGGTAMMRLASAEQGVPHDEMQTSIRKGEITVPATVRVRFELVD
ncbi:MAG: SIMPL domain-containing protein [Gammaproteobacteria bacterium]|nr:SIMPL domain-containing protein [Gammaproteobacteria bacterium]